MERQDIDDELARTGAQELLTSASMARLAYIGKDGTPRVIPIAFFWTGDQVVVSTATTSPKVTALSARPDVAVTIDVGETPGQARALSIRGRASVEIVDGVPEEYLAGAGRVWTPRRRPNASRTAARCTTRWRASRSRHTGCVTTTSAPAATAIPARPGRAEPVVTLEWLTGVRQPWICGRKAASSAESRGFHSLSAAR